MNILFLHGIRENYKDNPIYNSLKSLTDYNIINPFLDPWNPLKTLNSLLPINADLCIGFSLGGLFAASLNIAKKILINPALCFPDILKERRHINKKEIDEYESFSIKPGGWIKAIFTKNDKRIGLRSLPIYLKYFPEDSITYLPGDHILTKDQIVNNLIPLI